MIRVIKPHKDYKVDEILDLGCGRNRQAVREGWAIIVKMKDVRKLQTKSIKYEAL
jgi:hypothetical protein